MIVMNIGYGLGNQMFQYAFAKSLAIKNNDKFFISKKYYDSESGLRKFTLDKFALINDVDLIENHKCIDYLYSLYFRPYEHNWIPKFTLRLIDKTVSPLNVYNEVNVRKYKEIPYFTNKINIYTGIFQCSKYFDDIRDELVEDFKIKNISNETHKYGKMLSSTDSVCVHIRRQDYIGNNDACSINYYKNAISEIRKRIPNAIVYAFSDDIEWVKENFAEVFVVDFTSMDIEDLYLMSQCRHFIISNSTFSWWAQYLSDSKNKIVIAPNYWFKNCPTVEDCIYQDSWILMDV